jgi:hypothetical protein
MLPNTRTVLLSLALLTFTGCGVVVVNNSTPELSIVSPAANTVLAAGRPVTLVVRATDDQTATDALAVQWSSDLQDGLGGQVSVEEGDLHVLLPGGLGEGTHNLTVQVFDEQGLSASDSVSVEARPDAPPVVEILDPTDGSSFDPAALSLVASVDDDFDRVEDLLLVLTSDRDGNLAHEATITGNTVQIAVLDTLTDVDQVLDLKVFDLGAQMASDSVSLSADLNEAPTIQLLTPPDGEVFGDTTHIEVELVITDDSLDLTQLELTWFGLSDAAPCASCEWPTAVDANGERSFYLDLASCSDPNGTYYYPMGLTVRDPEGSTHTVEHLIGLSCLP